MFENSICLDVTVYVIVFDLKTAKSRTSAVLKPNELLILAVKVFVSE